jgi:hypothetical protein
MKKIEIKTIYCDCEVIKLKEYRQSYGGKEVIKVPFIREYDSEIALISDTGNVIRTLRKNTKLLISFSGKEISERAFNLRTNKNARLSETARQETIKANDEQLKKVSEIRKNQIALWVDFISLHPEKSKKYSEKIAQMNNNRKANYLRLKFAKHLNNGNFEGIEITGRELPLL